MVRLVFHPYTHVSWRTIGTSLLPENSSTGRRPPSVSPFQKVGGSKGRRQGGSSGAPYPDTQDLLKVAMILEAGDPFQAFLQDNGGFNCFWIFVLFPSHFFLRLKPILETHFWNHMMMGDDGWFPKPWDNFDLFLLPSTPWSLSLMFSHLHESWGTNPGFRFPFLWT